VPTAMPPSRVPSSAHLQVLLVWLDALGGIEVVSVIEALLTVPDEQWRPTTIRTRVPLRRLWTSHRPDLNAAKNLAALGEFGCVCLMAQLTTGQPVDWSKLPVRPAGWELDHSTRSSRGCARAGGRKADGGERKTAQRSSAGDDSFDREALSPPALS
jgi:hypothetical protein